MTTALHVISGKLLAVTWPLIADNLTVLQVFVS